MCPLSVNVYIECAATSGVAGTGFPSLSVPPGDAATKGLSTLSTSLNLAKYVPPISLPFALLDQ